MRHPFVIAATIRGAISSVALEYPEMTREEQEAMFQKLFMEAIEKGEPI